VMSSAQPFSTSFQRSDARSTTCGGSACTCCQRVTIQAAVCTAGLALAAVVGRRAHQRSNPQPWQEAAWQAGNKQPVLQMHAHSTQLCMQRLRSALLHACRCLQPLARISLLWG
jgi:hypothetical protein